MKAGFETFGLPEHINTGAREDEAMAGRSACKECFGQHRQACTGKLVRDG